jgi:hypothetical protein
MWLIEGVMVFNAKAKNSTDLYGTPPEATNLLLPYLKPFKKIWEPCCGFGAISAVLLRGGWEVVASDISTGLDALSSLPLEWQEVDAIVTNPPYTQKTEFLARCYALGRPFALLLPCDLVNKHRTALFRVHGVQLIVPDKRIQFLRFAGGGVSRASSPNMGSCWFTWGMNLPSDLIFTSLEEAR